MTAAATAPSERRLAGAVVSVDPLITIGAHEPNLPVGLASMWPERFESKPSLHFVRLTWSGEPQYEIDKITCELAAARRRLPRARFVFVVNTPYECAAFSRAGIPNIIATSTSFLDERLFVPQPARQARRYDAVYTARLDPLKRHELAASVPNLLLIYGPPTANELQRTRGILPRAVFANHEIEPGRYKHIQEHEVCALLNQSSVGLCLSAEEGAMRGAMEYLLCGLPVVSTESTGGRDRYLIGPHARIVASDAEAVARAVHELKAAAIPPLAVRDYVGRLITFDRHNFLSTANKLVERELGVRDRFRSFAPFVGFPVKWRLASEVEAGFAAP